MSAGPLAFWLRDLGQALAANADGPPLRGQDGGAWLWRSALLCVLAAATLWLTGGYHAGFLRFNAAAATSPDWVWQCFTALGDERIALASSLFLARRRPRVFWTLLLAAVLGILYSRGLKHLLDTLRPTAVLAADSFHLNGPAPRHHSFPSGHSTTAAVFFGVLLYHARWWETRTLLLLVALLVGLSRVAVGVHWPIDVAMGLAGGLLAAWGGCLLGERWSGPATDARVHLPLAALAAGFALSLLLWDSGYDLARPLYVAVGASALAYGILVYGLLPLLRFRRATSDPGAPP